jgi:hypothetical protein
LHEVRRSVSWEGTSGLGKGQFADASWIKRIVDYVIDRQNNDGGYTFCQDTESNAHDTYYGLAILDLLKVPFPNVELTIKWLHDFIPDSYYSHYYAAKALKLCGQEPDEKLRDFLLSLQGPKGGFRTVDVYVEVASEFEATFIFTELVKLVGIEIDREEVVRWLLSHQNRDGGFGAHGYSNLSSTYHAVASLFNLGYPVKSLKGTLAYVRSCEKPSGGFTVVPSSSLPYMEHVYYGMATLDLIGENARYPKATARFVLSCQNSNGGFARSNLGISTFEDTFYAIWILRRLASFGG